MVIRRIGIASMVDVQQLDGVFGVSIETDRLERIGRPVGSWF
jgi:hypothetical protein